MSTLKFQAMRHNFATMPRQLPFRSYIFWLTNLTQIDMKNSFHALALAKELFLIKNLMSTDMLNIQLCILNCIRDMEFLVSAEIYTAATLLAQKSSLSWGKIVPHRTWVPLWGPGINSVCRSTFRAYSYVQQASAFPTWTLADKMLAKPLLGM